MKISVMGMNQDELLSGKALAEMGNEIIHVCKDNTYVEDMKKRSLLNRRKRDTQYC